MRFGLVRKVAKSGKVVLARGKDVGWKLKTCEASLSGEEGLKAELLGSKGEGVRWVCNEIAKFARFRSETGQTKWKNEKS